MEFSHPHSHAKPRAGLAIGNPTVKKAFMIASLAVWTLSLVTGIGFAVVGEVTGVKQLPDENYQLRAERDSLRDEMIIERNNHAGVIEAYRVAISRWEFQNDQMVESLRFADPIVAAVGPLPHEE